MKTKSKTKRKSQKLKNINIHKKATKKCHFSQNTIQYTNKKDVFFKLREKRYWYKYVIKMTNNIARYQNLQNEIATKQQSEQLRPMIHFQAYNQLNDDADVHVKPVFLLGGMGPLADASIVSTVLKQLQKKKTRYNLHLFSLPPPRNVFAVSKMMYYSKYLKNINKCLKMHSIKNTCMFLLSNTAHLNRNILNTFNTHTFNLIPSIVQRIKSNHGSNMKNKNEYMILSTTRSQSSQLYESWFEKDKLVSLDTDQQTMVQNSIQLLKENKYNYQNDVLLHMIQEITKSKLQSSFQLILACTELSLWCKKSKIYQIPSTTVNIHDTANIMSDIIVDYICHPTKSNLIRTCNE